MISKPKGSSQVLPAFQFIISEMAKLEALKLGQLFPREIIKVPPGELT